MTVKPYSSALKTFIRNWFFSSKSNHWFMQNLTRNRNIAHTYPKLGTQKFTPRDSTANEFTRHFISSGYFFCRACVWFMIGFWFMVAMLSIRKHRMRKMFIVFDKRNICLTFIQPNKWSKIKSWSAFRFFFIFLSCWVFQSNYDFKSDINNDTRERGKRIANNRTLIESNSSSKISSIEISIQVDWLHKQ